MEKTRLKTHKDSNTLCQSLSPLYGGCVSNREGSYSLLFQRWAEGECAEMGDISALILSLFPDTHGNLPHAEMPLFLL